ncbi:hypothetical protein GCM10010156_37000 [Planobispora rosea]|uniref:Uncharacterized protein n=1 Tax=Planobispora rosea TaxID=35762 RepID=A0A8J3RW51_PLARO|nr:hypothetical protein GCM10010156_37000 [Planobispora rosea]GIH81775.1 hypothetical protein Pro02_01830 [Planobispora rosea]
MTAIRWCPFATGVWAWAIRVRRSISAADSAGMNRLPDSNQTSRLQPPEGSGRRLVSRCSAVSGIVSGPVSVWASGRSPGRVPGGRPDGDPDEDPGGDVDGDGGTDADPDPDGADPAGDTGWIRGERSVMTGVLSRRTV